MRFVRDLGLAHSEIEITVPFIEAGFLTCPAGGTVAVNVTRPGLKTHLIIPGAACYAFNLSHGIDANSAVVLDPLEVGLVGDSTTSMPLHTRLFGSC